MKSLIQNQIIQVIKTLAKPVDFNEIHTALERQYKERSLRRWLSELAEKGLISKTGQKKGTRYGLIANAQNTQDQQSTKPVNDDFNQVLNTASRQAIANVRRPIFTRQPVTYNDDWIEDYKPNQTFYLPADAREELSTLGMSDMTNERAGTFAKKIFNRLLIDLSYNSSRLEGNTYSLIDTEKLIIDGVNNNEKLDEERVMILNHKEAIRFLVDKAESIEINPTEICTLHYLLADALVLPGNAGHIRQEAVRISSTTYQPLDNSERLKQRLKIICQKAASIMDPFEQSIFLLIHIAYLQPFIDVNKRTSRLSANIPLIKHNKIPLSFNDVDKNYYIDAMIAIYELNNVHALVDIYCFSYLRSCEYYKVASDVIGFDAIRVRYRPQRKEIIRYIINNQLVHLVMNEYIDKKITNIIPAKDMQAFTKTVYEDLNTINNAKIQGMGITQQALSKWLNKSSQTNTT